MSFKRYRIQGYTSNHADFTDTVTLDAALLADLGGYGDASREAWRTFKEALLDTSIPTDYLDVIDWCDFQHREDLQDTPNQYVLLAESLGCDNCTAQGHNEWIDGCNDEPHGGYMLTLEEVSNEHV